MQYNELVSSFYVAVSCVYHLFFDRVLILTPSKAYHHS